MLVAMAVWMRDRRMKVYDVGVEYCVYLGNGAIYFDQIMRSYSAAVGSAPLPLEYCVRRPPPIRVPAPRIYPCLPPNVSNQHTTYLCQPAHDSIHGVT